jgi:hypothetical protein
MASVPRSWSSTAFTQRENPATPQELDEWWGTFRRADATVEVLGSQQARDASHDMIAALEDAYNTLAWNSPEFEESLRTTYMAHWEKIGGFRERV